MTSPYFLAAGEVGAASTAVDTRPQIPRLTLESMDGNLRIPLDGTEGFIRMPGSTGLEMPPVEIISTAIPGVVGTHLADVRIMERPVFVPIYAGGDGDMGVFRARLRLLYRIVDPTGRRPFRLVGESAEGARELIVTYTGGLEGADDAAQAGLSWARFGLNAVAHSPYAQARQDRVLTFRNATVAEPFLGVVGGTDAPWPGAISTSSVIGQGMPVQINSEVPVYPTVVLKGAMDSFQGTLSPVVFDEYGIETVLTDQEWLIDVPGGVPGGSSMRLVTDPRLRSFRFDGELGAERVSIGSRLRPFYPGRNTLNVSAPGSTEETVVTLSWREMFRSLW